MKKTAFLLLLAILRVAHLAHAVRLSEDGGNQASVALSMDPAKFAKTLVSKFSSAEHFPEDRPALAAIRSTEMKGGAGGNEHKYEYLSTKCMKKRAFWAAEQFKAAGCGRILEVGGYSTPLPSVVDDADLPDDLELYVDVDPSAKETKLESFSKKFSTATLKIILDEFRERTKKDPAKTAHIGNSFDCFLMLGTTAQNIGDETSKVALKDAIGQAKMAIIEFPSSNPDTPGHFLPVMEDAGMAKSATHRVDCADDEESVARKGEGCGENNVCLTRNMVVYSKHSDSGDAGSED
eukprot:TRINITY_DN6751_c0_g1_i1.p1 TRINITY_DN6751_c0_g1~~TRINITY_DN6751_c0_g1_i1.p1  ORF type:complete len:293 (-),score=81.42 TRINITY_DN6751_c0_g1_i1:115-993(-)